MVFIQKSLGDLLSESKFEKIILYEILEEMDILSFLNTFCETVYIMKILSTIGISKYCSDWHAVSLAIENCIVRGNKEIPYCLVSIKIFSGKKFNIIRLRDSGLRDNYENFDFQMIIEKMKLGDFSYKKGYGEGIKGIDASTVFANYEGDGSIINLMVKNRGIITIMLSRFHFWIYKSFVEIIGPNKLANFMANN